MTCEEAATFTSGEVVVASVIREQAATFDQTSILQKTDMLGKRGEIRFG